MPANHLEQLVAEWYEYRGYFVRRNVRVGRLVHGGFECELDVVAWHPEAKHVVHIEPTMDSNPWDKRIQRYTKKLRAGRKHIPSMFSHVNILPKDIKQIILLGYGSNTNHEVIDGAEVKTTLELLSEILADLRDIDMFRRAVPEQFTILRTLQLIAGHRKKLVDVLTVK
ncbi:MAG: hypothetical protein R3C45_03320 [Phycisphaerales bacterium]